VKLYDPSCPGNSFKFYVIEFCTYLAPSEGHIPVKVKFALEQVMKAQRGSTDIPLLFL
jgi:hypothetical protein